MKKFILIYFYGVNLFFDLTIQNRFNNRIIQGALAALKNVTRYQSN